MWSGGCDYTGSIKGIGPTTALRLMKEHHSIEAALQHVDLAKHKLPDPFQHREAHELFAEAEVLDGSRVQLEWKDADRDGLVAFLVKEKGFNQDRVESALRKLKAARSKGAQGRIDSFFTLKPKERTGEDEDDDGAGTDAKKKKEKAAAAKRKGATGKAAPAKKVKK